MHQDFLAIVKGVVRAAIAVPAQHEKVNVRDGSYSLHLTYSMLVQNVARQSKLAEFVAECVEEIEANKGAPKRPRHKPAFEYYTKRAKKNAGGEMKTRKKRLDQ